MEIALRVHVVWRISSNISGRTGPIFSIFSPYESALQAHDGTVIYFPICQGTLPWQPNHLWTSCITQAKKLTYFVKHFRIHWTDFRNLFTVWKRYTCRWWNSNLFSHLSRDVAMATKSFVNVRFDMAQKTDIFCWISPDILHRFLQFFSPYESFVCIDDGSLPYFSISEGTLPWQPNHLQTSGTTRPKNWHILSNISGYTGPIFATFSPYESSLCTDGGSVLFFPNLVNFRPVISEFTLLKRALFAAMHPQF